MITVIIASFKRVDLTLELCADIDDDVFPMTLFETCLLMRILLQRLDIWRRPTRRKATRAPDQITGQDS
jgi:hypothetical protein